MSFSGSGGVSKREKQERENGFVLQCYYSVL
jgi:hypothetical protein